MVVMVVDLFPKPKSWTGFDRQGPDHLHACRFKKEEFKKRRGGGLEKGLIGREKKTKSPDHGDTANVTYLH